MKHLSLNDENSSPEVNENFSPEEVKTGKKKLLISFVGVFSLSLVVLISVILTTDDKNIDRNDDCFSSTVVNFTAVILAGQSNMSGRAPIEDSDRVVNPKVIMTENNTIVLAKEPTHLQYESIAALSPGLAFGNHVVSLLEEDIGGILLIPAAIGGSRMSVWLTDTLQRGFKPLTNLNEKVNLARSCEVEVGAVLWIHGRGEGSSAAAFYQQSEALLFEEFRNITKNPDLLILSASVNDFGSKSEETIELVNEGKAFNAATDENVVLINTSDLSEFDGSHYDTESVREIGRRMAEAFVTELFL